MKAILVIDVDDCINVEPCKADVYVRFPFQSNGMINPKATFQEFADGWNACLKELEK